MYIKMVTNPAWIGKNWKILTTVSSLLYGLISFMFGYISAVNATVDDYPKLVGRVNRVENVQIAVREDSAVFRAQFSTFLEMYKLEVLGRKSEARDIARTLETSKP